jgi:hypothetical protein
MLGQAGTVCWQEPGSLAGEVAPNARSWSSAHTRMLESNHDQMVRLSTAFHQARSSRAGHAPAQLRCAISFLPCFSEDARPAGA